MSPLPGPVPAADAPVASGVKIAYHRERLRAYLRGEPIDPVSLEIDLTSRCSRACPDCPSTRAASHWELDRGFLERIFGRLAGRSTGVLFTGGEPTLSPLLPDALALARRAGFIDAAVVTNGHNLDAAPVAAALLEHASTIRLSLYDWEGSNGHGRAELAKIEGLRSRVEREGSRLRLGVSVLTSSERLPRLEPLVRSVADAGVHWVYFHPRCRNWQGGRPSPEDQSGVLEEIGRLRALLEGRVSLQVSPDRYRATPLRFSGYHAAHFLLIVGADRKNYLGAEVKYQPRHVVADLAGPDGLDALRSAGRAARIAGYTDANSDFQGSRHRGALYSDFVERLKAGNPEALATAEAPPAFSFPHVL